MNTAIIDTKDGMLILRTPYDPLLVQSLKTTIPSADRRWNAASKVWEIDPAWAQTLQMLCTKHGYPTPALPAGGVVNTAPAQATMRILEVRYLGRVKERPGGEQSAYAWVDGGWNAIFPKAALFDWFGKEDRPGEAATLYQVLGLKQGAAGAEIKAAWKRLARMWHPDTCREPDAASQFRAIKDAYDVLADPAKRARYDAGLALEATWKNQAYTPLHEMAAMVVEWAPPLRCGQVMVEGVNKLGRFVVGSILGWQDIVKDGKALVTSWPMGADMFVERWVTL